MTNVVKTNVLLAKYSIGQLLFWQSVALAKCCVSQMLCVPNIVCAKCCVCKMLCQPNVGCAKCCVCQMLCLPNVVTAKCCDCQMSQICGCYMMCQIHATNCVLWKMYQTIVAQSRCCFNQMLYRPKCCAGQLI
jgi:hypothetical protein